MRACAVEIHMHVMLTFAGKMPRPRMRHTLCAVEMHMDMPQKPFMQKLTGQMPRPMTATHTVCEPAQSKCTWTCDKSHYLQEKCGAPCP